MNIVKHLFPEGRQKAFTLSYDDGVCQDIRLIEIFNKYALKATFNINSGIQFESQTSVKKGKIIKRLNQSEIVQIYRGHEVAIHSHTHPHLEDLPRESIIQEILEDRKNLEKWFGYVIRGMAYPFGTYNNLVLEVVNALGIEYSRTVKQHENFSLPENYLEWHPTCHHENPKFMDIAKKFVETQFSNLSLFYVWGHSYEFDVEENWELIEEFSKLISNRCDIWYATNIEIIDYIKALKNLKISAENSIIYNPNSISLWVSVNGESIEIVSGETKKI
jgi:peptidoglycan/xylan/chitin deacetylase (PgdA/CDA1 family)